MGLGSSRGVEELSRRSSVGAVGCRDGAVNQCALQKEGTFPFSADGRGAVWEIIAFFPPKNGYSRRVKRSSSLQYPLEFHQAE